MDYDDADIRGRDDARAVRRATEQEYNEAAVNFRPMTMRETIEKRPDMYFGQGPRAGWPLVMMGLTVVTLGGHVPSPGRTATVTVHPDGDFTVSVRGATTSWQPTVVETAETALRNDLWWRHVVLATTVTISDPPGGSTTDEYERQVLDDVDLSARMRCDPDFTQSDASVWWDDWTSRLPAMVDHLARRPEHECRVVMIDERMPVVDR